MTLKTDCHAVDKHGTRDFELQCHKRPFAMTVSPLLPKSPENLIDQELVEFLEIPIKKIEECEEINTYDLKRVFVICQQLKKLYLRFYDQVTSLKIRKHKFDQKYISDIRISRILASSKLLLKK